MGVTPEQAKAWEDYWKASEGLYEAEREAYNNHWVHDHLDTPDTLIAVVETKIARAALSERRRIISLVKEVWEGRCSPVMEPDECSVCWLSSSIIKKIEGENE